MIIEQQQKQCDWPRGNLDDGCLVDGLCDIADKTRVKTCDEEFILWRVVCSSSNLSRFLPGAYLTSL